MRVDEHAADARGLGATEDLVHGEGPQCTQNGAVIPLVSEACI